MRAATSASALIARVGRTASFTPFPNVEQFTNVEQ